MIIEEIFLSYSNIISSLYMYSYYFLHYFLLLSSVSQLDEWIYDEGADVEASVYKEKLKELSKLFEPIKQRVFEHLNRPEAVQARNETILIYLSLLLICALCLGLVHYWDQKLTIDLHTRSHEAREKGGRDYFFTRFFALQTRLWSCLSPFVEYLKGKGRVLRRNMRAVDPSAWRTNRKPPSDAKLRNRISRNQRNER